ncbi:MAG TPA: YbaK/EbsC family protein [Steroidobacteraceae bacterium]|nr:YbaK/EbsC family protein [Steroidobacteraceae bacterium]
MAIPASVRNYLDQEGVVYDAIPHSRTVDSSRSAQAAHVPGDQLAKCVVLEDDNGYLMAVIPASHRLDLRSIRRELSRELGLATEREVLELFRDCEPGAVPPLGRVYGIDMVLDQSLVDAREAYFEAGDHESLIRVSGRDFLKLMADCPRRSVSHHL